MKACMIQSIRTYSNGHVELGLYYLYNDPLGLEHNCTVFVLLQHQSSFFHKYWHKSSLLFIIYMIIHLPSLNTIIPLYFLIWVLCKWVNWNESPKSYQTQYFMQMRSYKPSIYYFFNQINIFLYSMYKVL